MAQQKTYNDGSVYNGRFNDKGEKDGVGTLTLKDSTKYHGSFKSGFFDGFGVMELPGKHKYQGQFSKGKFHGFGVFTQGDNLKYEGEFQNGVIQGLGRATFPDNTNGLPHYEGRFANGEIVERQICSPAVDEARKAAKTAAGV